jgi:hypothetical protein
MKSFLLYVKTYGMHKISDAVRMHTRSRVCVCVCVGVGEGGTCAFIMGCPFSYLAENSNFHVMAWQAKALSIIKLPCSQTQEKEHTVFCLS